MNFSCVFGAFSDRYSDPSSVYPQTICDFFFNTQWLSDKDVLLSSAEAVKLPVSLMLDLYCMKSDPLSIYMPPQPLNLLYSDFLHLHRSCGLHAHWASIHPCHSPLRTSTAYHYIIQMDVTKNKCFKSFTPSDPLSTYMPPQPLNLLLYPQSFHFLLWSQLSFNLSYSLNIILMFLFCF